MTEKSGMNRFPPLSDDMLDEDQQRMSGLAMHNGPYWANLRAPLLWEAWQAVRRTLSGKSLLDGITREAVMLRIARHWNSTAGFAAHAPLARKAGLSDDAITAIGEGQVPQGLPSVTVMAMECATELLERHGLDDALHARATELLGERFLVEIVGLIGFFSATSLTLNLMGSKGEAPFECGPGQFLPSTEIETPSS